ncbi:hypothetical protein [Marinibactrum halimedae]|uniref:Uncharacterized protein n=1 Tax=Marinibactrum halimedae TaxID=1444977 RepID=A0AA37WKC3_9GAMM|nr:hypothetical protein [Marinibactrum halimedae]MCD9460987.1 hypothetical protein [Marinibactrum halimedae]GLS24783.1 hypothetical protein GCM10007877_04970 [Marinibactrum halimedae]
MNINEIENYLNSGSTKSICIDRRLSDTYEGFVRDLVIKRDQTLSVEYNTYGYDEGGLVLLLKYENFELLIKSIECYLGLKLTEWMNVNKSGYYPDNPKIVDFDVSGRLLKQHLFDHEIDFPKGWMNMELPSDYWAGIYNRRIKVQ